MISDFNTPSAPLIKADPIQISNAGRTVLLVVVMGIAAYKLYMVLEMIKPGKGKK